MWGAGSQSISKKPPGSSGLLLATSWKYRSQKPGSNLPPARPFQGDLQEIPELFNTFRELKMVHLLKRTTGIGTRRRFDFEDFFTKRDEKQAFSTLSQHG